MPGRTTPLLRLAGQALGGLSRAERRTGRWLLAGWAAMLGLQIWDISGRAGAGAMAEILGVSALLGGVLFLGFAWMLQTGFDRSPPADRQAQAATLQLLPILASIGATCCGFAGAMYLARAMLGTPPWLVLIVGVIVAVMIAVGWGLVVRTVRALDAGAREEAARASRAEADAVQARLDALQAQMQPHFLFNALNTVAALVPTNPGAAERTIERLSAVLRGTLSQSRRRTTALDDELRLVEAYLSVERERLGDRLKVTFDIAADTRGLSVPAMSLQPLVENALIHAVGSRLSGGSVRVVASKHDGRLRVAVQDDGDGFREGWREGTGLGNLRRRLETAYGDAAPLTVAAAPTGGAIVALDLPAVVEAVDASDRR